jgi:putative tryptophan/tyrosine transport system substrate-binding protein
MRVATSSSTRRLGGAAAWAVAAGAQQADRVRRIGVLMPYPETDPLARRWTQTFEQSLQELGWASGQNVVFDYRWPGGNIDQLSASARELVRLKPDLLVGAATVSVLPLQRETQSVPILFVNAADPVGQGFVASLARPGGNITGFGAFEFSLGAKWVEALKEIMPGITEIGVMFNPETSPYYGLFAQHIEAAARHLGIVPLVKPFHDIEHVVTSLEEFAKVSNIGIIVIPSVLLTAARDLLIVTTSRLRLPTIYPYSFFAQSGGLISYGFDVRDMFRRGAGYADLILRGTKPADLPVQQPTKFELVINLRAANDLGLALPQTLLAIADAVIE